MSTLKARGCIKRISRFLAAVTLAGCPALWGTEIIAHRGASYDAPENTMPAVLLGWEQGADAVEIDVYLAKDGQIVVLHDDDTKRTTGVAGKVIDATFEQLRQLDAGRWKHSRWTGTRIPSLEEVLAAVPPGKKLFIEIKCGVEITPALKRLVEASGKKDQLVVIAFSYDVVKEIKAAMPYLPAYWLYGFREHDGRPILTHEQLLERVKAAGADGLDVYYGGPVTKGFVEQLAAAGMKLYVYTVNSPEVARKLAALGVAGITTDRPAYLREALEVEGR